MKFMAGLANKHGDPLPDLLPTFDGGWSSSANSSTDVIPDIAEPAEWDP